MKEQCKAGASTAARIPGTDLLFTPPEGWVYAQLEEATVAQRGEQGAVLLLTTYQRVGAPLKRARKRTELIGSLSELVDLQPHGGKVVLYRPTEKNEIAGLDMSLWERSGAHRADDEGSLLVLESDVGERTLFGVGFAPKDDAAGTSAILSAIESLRSGSGKSQAAEQERAGSGEREDE